jgi:hypothetical protein
MSWEVVPEIFFDLVARVVPGSLLLLMALLVAQGPKAGVRELGEYVSAAGVNSVLAFTLAAYFTAVVLKQVWRFLAARVTKKRKRSDKNAEQDDLYRVYSAVRVKSPVARAEELPESRIVLACIRRSLPEEGLRLLKIQAEKDLCEVLLPGLIALSLLDGWFLFSDRVETVGRTCLLLFNLFSWLCCFSWRKDLERLFEQDLCALWRLLEVAGKALLRDVDEKR